MNVNVNDISGFDAMIEEIRWVYAERDRLRDENEALRQFKKDICAALGVRSDMSTRETLGEIRKLRKEHENLKYAINKQEDFTEEAASILGVKFKELTLSDISACLRKICAELDIEYSTDTTPDDICNRIRELHEYRDCLCYCPVEVYNKICDILRTDKITSSWGDILEAVHDLYTEKIDLSTKVFGQQQAIKQFELSLKNTRDDAIKAHHRRKEWVRRYEAEHKRANSCDRLYKKYKALYDADEPKREKMANDLQVCREGYKVVKNAAVKNKSMMDAVANIVGTVGMHDDVTLTGVLNARKKANHWDALVDGYGEGTMRSLLENIGIDVSGDKGTGLF